MGTNVLFRGSGAVMGVTTGRIERPIRQVAVKHSERAVAPQAGQQFDELWLSSYLGERLAALEGVSY